VRAGLVNSDGQFSPCVAATHPNGWDSVARNAASASRDLKYLVTPSTRSMRLSGGLPLGPQFTIYRQGSHSSAFFVNRSGVSEAISSSPAA